MTEAQWWKGQHVVSVKQFDIPKLKCLVEKAFEMKKLVETRGKANVLEGKVLANVFFEPSTRTRCSFEAAMKRLGGDVINISASGSSAKKGETLQDTIRCLACYTDTVVLRHPQKGSAALVSKYIDIPLLNAGDGAGEHPTQALLDLFTIVSELKKYPDGAHVALVGDLKYGRTVHSLVQILALYSGVRLSYVAPDALQMPAYIEKAVDAIKTSKHVEGFKPATQKKYAMLDEVIDSVDVMYVTRIQKERFEDPKEYEKHKGAFVISKKTATSMKKGSVIMHPLPRVGEILEEVDDDPRAAYFRQMRNGMYTRMAILALVNGK